MNSRQPETTVDPRQETLTVTCVVVIQARKSRSVVVATKENEPEGGRVLIYPVLSPPID